MAHTITFDTLSFSKKMIKAGFTQQQAEGQAEALIEIVDNNLATKHDISLIQKDIKILDVKIESIKNNTKTILWLIGSVAFIFTSTQLLKIFGFQL